MPMKAVMFALYRDEDYIVKLIGDRKLIAFNIAAPSAVKTHSVIWVRSLVNHLADRPPIRPSDDEIIADIFPVPLATIRGAHVARLFICGHDHVKHLVNAGALKLAPGREKRGLPILRESLIQFIRKARIS